MMGSNGKSQQITVHLQREYMNKRKSLSQYGWVLFVLGGIFPYRKRQLNRVACNSPVVGNGGYR